MTIFINYHRKFTANVYFKNNNNTIYIKKAFRKYTEICRNKKLLLNSSNDKLVICSFVK